VAEVDAPDLVLAGRQAEAGLEQAEGLMKAAEAGVAVARADVSTAQVAVKQREAELTTAQAGLKFRQLQYDRVKGLLRNTAGVTQLDLDKAQGEFEAAKGQVDAATVAVEKAGAELGGKKAQVIQAEAAVTTQRANVTAAKIGLERAQAALARTQVRALIDGVVTRREGYAGEYVRGDPATERPPVTIVRTDVVRVVVEVPAQFAAVTRPGVPAELTFATVPAVRVSGKVARAGFTVAPDRTIRVEIDVPNPDGNLRPGMVGEARLRLGAGPAGALRIPRQAAWELGKEMAVGDARWAVYVYRDGKARLTPVRSDYQVGDEIEVLSGLKADDLVVGDLDSLRVLILSDGHGPLRPEVPVQGKPPESK
jgi:HlyD family secretion protein